MAGVPKSILCLIILVLLANTQAGNALLIDNQVVSRLLVTGVACCSPNGSCGGTGPPITNSDVFLVANNNVIAVGKVDPQGQVRIIVSNLGLLGSILSIANLAVRIPVPISGCAILASATGNLLGPITVLTVIGGAATTTFGPLTLTP